MAATLLPPVEKITPDSALSGASLPDLVDTMVRHPWPLLGANTAHPPLSRGRVSWNYAPLQSQRPQFASADPDLTTLLRS